MLRLSSSRGGERMSWLMGREAALLSQDRLPLAVPHRPITSALLRLSQCAQVCWRRHNSAHGLSSTIGRWVVMPADWSVFRTVAMGGGLHSLIGKGAPENWRGELKEGPNGI
jgi:hypothetical protein